MPSSTVCLTFDFDAISVWFGYSTVTPSMRERGEYGARVGVPRLLQMLSARGLQATFFIPGHTVESFPQETLAILEAGHEIAHHSYAHQDPSTQTRDEEAADMDRALQRSIASACVLSAIARRPRTCPTPRSSCSRSAASSTTRACRATTTGPTGRGSGTP